MDEEEAYLQRYPDVARAIRSGVVASALDHYLRYGRSEGRRWLADGGKAAGSDHRGGVPVATREAGLAELPHNCESAFVTSGTLFVCGWVDDRADALVAIEAVGREESARRGSVHRTRREDVEAHLAAAFPFEAGFWSLIADPDIAPNGASRVLLRFASGRALELTPAKVVCLGSRELLAAFLTFFAERHVLGSLVARSFVAFENGLVPVIAGLHHAVRETYALSSEARYGRDASPTVSLVCCLYGIPDFLFLQVARFARFGGLEDVEFIYGNNSPELEQVVHRDAEIAAYLFGTSVRVLSFNQNTGFSHANNAGIERSRGKVVVVINPDVFPRDAASLGALRALAEQRQPRALIGGKLFYADGSVMHEGMVFSTDSSLSQLARCPVCTVEHRRKGFADRADHTRRAAPAISGALMVARRAELEKVGGFDEEFIYGYYEDADLCLRFRKHGGEVLYEPSLAFWHYEGRGSIRRPEHAGAAHYNRWLFSRRWGRESARTEPAAVQ